PDVDRHQATSVLERFQQSLSEAHTGGHPRFTASFGVTDSSKAESLEQLLQLVDIGLYESKQAGRDRITISETVADPPDLTVVHEQPAPGNGKRSRKPRQPAIHDAASDEEPHASG